MNKKHHRATARKKPSVATDTASSPTGWRLYSWLPCPDTSSTQTLGGRMIFKPIKHHTVNILSVLQVQNETPDLNYFWLIHWESLLWYLTLPKYLMSSTCILRTFFPFISGIVVLEMILFCLILILAWPSSKGQEGGSSRHLQEMGWHRASGYYSGWWGRKEGRNPLPPFTVHLCYQNGVASPSSLGMWRRVGLRKRDNFLWAS